MCDRTRRCFMSPGLRGTILTPWPGSLLGQAPNGIQIVASVTVEFVRGGKPRRLASSSAKSSRLASQHNSAETEAPLKPTPGSMSGVFLFFQRTPRQSILMFWPR
ncbi:hypothetical protein KUCAC02_025439 [Chaenocephalus aceratus]|uniref:Uncharacterized protein n=1 Tax=Chaenocephalus aceratus TaxID=36190 RepID=A0ACB9VUF9_CHAAC|nr:hypothetical protein KUCAC02_025439 [Chaenocephalus aceratus]